MNYLINLIIIKYNQLIIYFSLIYYKINLGIGDWGLGPIPNPQSPILYNFKNLKINFLFLIEIQEYIPILLYLL